MRKILYLLLIVISACSTVQSSKGTKGEQEKTVDAIRDLGTAIEAYKLANNHYPEVSSGDVEKLRDKLVPKYLKELRYHDGWGNKLEYYCLKPEGPYYIISLGADKERDVDLYKTDRSPSGLGFKEISNLNEDIIFSNGVFVRYPKGTRVGS
jgi:Bacterial type II secretion system protein G.